MELFHKWFNYNVSANLAWAKNMSIHEDDLTHYCLSTMSHIINVEHLWLNRILGLPVESDDWDILPLAYFERFLKENDELIKRIQLQFSTDQLIRYTDSENTIQEKMLSDLLFNILNHSNYHRAQLAKEFRMLDLPVIPTNYIEFNS